MKLQDKCTQRNLLIAKSDIEGPRLPLINDFTKLEFYRNRYFRIFITGVRVKNLSHCGNYL